jgi:hypothetical protein
MATTLTDSSIFPATTTVPSDGDTASAASLWLGSGTGFQGLTNRTRYLAELMLGPAVTPPAIAATGRGSGVARVQQTADASPTELRSLPGNLGDVAYVNGYGLYQLNFPEYTAGSADDSFYYLEQNLLTTTIPPWTPSTRYAVGQVVQNGGNVYNCTTAGTSAAAGSAGPTGSGSYNPDGTANWNHFTGTPQWQHMLANLRGGVNYAFGNANGN